MKYIILLVLLFLLLGCEPLILEPDNSKGMTQSDSLTTITFEITVPDFFTDTIDIQMP